MKTASLIVTFICAALLAACSDTHPAADASNGKTAETGDLQRQGALVTVPAGSPLRKSLVVTPIEQQAFAQTIDAPGVIQAVPEKLVKITSPLAGRIVRLHHQLGDSVKAGEALVTIDSPDLGLAYSDHVKAQATLAQARQEFARQSALQEQDISAKKDFEAAQLALSAAQSDARASTDRLAQLGVSVGRDLRREYVLRAPISGRVVEMNGSQGGYWNDNTASIMTVADLSTVWLSASVPEKDLPRIFLGQAARIVPNAYAHRAFDGKVQYIGDLLDPDTRTASVRIAIDNRAGLFKPGMFARVGFTGSSHPTLLAPASALLQSGLYTRVFVEQAPFRFESRVVSVGATVGDRVEVLSGLKAGERIVIHDGVLLND
ncbi:efflux RND transporter periplasmic adaptor subunit [Xanthomonas axonopodis pv. poinsettiicola]|uniref:efflux RND transporter periplasmic adaptor subunit n=1 Tax=Xanthomonas TaxID=338 RepID=UPI001E39ECEF|nr:efflux RND transporter periplasmic adaptor subunit [Xanthomonas codiaei]MCC8535811.1 efflux RND transporter periplasmic adaptor subunit [Xanthomonas codiaei]